MFLLPRFLCAAGVLFVVAHPALASPKCTKAERAKWMSEADMKDKATASGIEIEVFKVTKGNCYEVYGRNAKGERVEIYYDPVTGTIVKQEVI